jgi:3-deoxy-D-manno-octulosonic-acid transferase
MMGVFFYQIFLALYRLAIWVASIFNGKAKQWVRGRIGLLQKMEASLANVPHSAIRRRIWMHCASLGEFEQGRPVLEKIKQQYPSTIIILTFFSPSGYENQKNYKGVDFVFYLPMDGPLTAKRFVNIVQPDLVLWVKYEYWYYYLSALAAKNIPVLMISGLLRPGQPFFAWYGGIWRKMLHCFTYYFVQNSESKTLLESLSIKDKTTICGDTRFDRVLEIAGKFEPLPLIERFCGAQKVIVAGSTWDDDEAVLAHYIKQHPAVKFIIAPHEIDVVNIQDIQKLFPKAICYSELSGKNLNTSTQNHEELFAAQVLIIDNIGMLSRLYYYADITYVGGGFNAGGIHNVIEAAVFGKVVFFGPVYEKFADAVGLVETGAGISINSALEFEKILNQVLENETEQERLSEAAASFVAANAGATDAVMRYIYEKRLLTN